MENSKERLIKNLDKLFVSSRIFPNSDEFPDFINGGVLVSAQTGSVTRIFKDQCEVNSFLYNQEAEVFDYEDAVIMPGLIDTHVHINDPGRSDWEGFETATKAGAAGGFTTICDMPLNSIPPTTTLENLKTKVKASKGKLYVDVAFWGGLIPGNEEDVEGLINQGVVGFKCFLCPSGVPEFPHVNEEYLDKVMPKMVDCETVVAFHAELECPNSHNHATNGNSKKYETYLASRPDHMEEEAIKLVAKMAIKYRIHCHILHLSSTNKTLKIIKAAREEGAKLTVETCHHYLSISSEDIPDAQTEFKCSPPIRGIENQKELWKALKEGVINLVVSDHSPNTPRAKLLIHGRNKGNFMEAWGGISSVQFGLSLFWTNCQKYGLGIKDLVRFLCTEPAKLVGIDNKKGKLGVGYDGDICVWHPTKSFTVTRDIIEFQNKANPYMEKILQGEVQATFIRGLCVYDAKTKFGDPMGNVIWRKSNVKITKFIIK